MGQEKGNGLAVALLCLLTVPTSPVLAEEPSNAQLYEMYLKLREELTATQAENRALREKIETRERATTPEASASHLPVETPRSEAIAPVDEPIPPKKGSGPLAAVKGEPIPTGDGIQKELSDFPVGRRQCRLQD